MTSNTGVDYNSTSDYHKHDEVLHTLRESVSLLKEYQWIYNFQLTKIFVDRILENIPEEWISCLKAMDNEDLNNLPFGVIQDCWPGTLKSFVRRAVECSQHYQQLEVKMEEAELGERVRRGMNPKKQHEVSRLAALVHSTCQQAGCRAVLDVGSGLGYLGHVLHKSYGYRVTGLECEESRVHGAEARVAKDNDILNYDVETIAFRLSDTKESVAEFQYILNQIMKDKSLVIQKCDTDSRKPGTEKKSDDQQDNSDSCRHILEKVGCSMESDLTTPNITSNKSREEMTTSDRLSELHPPDCAMCPSIAGCTESESSWCSGQHIQEQDRLCMIGLHSCADLVPVMLRLYSQLEEIHALVVVGCCYHRMKYSEEKFEHFPMSKLVTQLLGSNEDRPATWSLNPFAFRLATQETRKRWKSQSQEEHSDHMRHVAYRAVLEHVITTVPELSVKRSKKLAHSSDFSSFVSYVKAVSSSLTLTGCSVGEFSHLMFQAHDCYQDCFPLIEPLTALQFLLQPVLESLIITDRLLFIEEQGFKASAVPIFDDNISPRSIAIVSYKQD